MKRADLIRRLAALEALPKASELPTAPEGRHIVGRGLLVPDPMPLQKWLDYSREVHARIYELEKHAYESL